MTTRTAADAKNAGAELAAWTPPVDDSQCTSTVANVNPVKSGERLLIPCPRPASKACPTCGHRYCAECWRRHCQKDPSRPGSHGWCAASARPKSAKKGAA